MRRANRRLACYNRGLRLCSARESVGLTYRIVFRAHLRCLRAMARVLVTGATGFIGVHLVRQLRGQGDEVACLVRRTSTRTGLEPLGVEFIEGDVGEASSVVRAVAGCDVVYHLAGLTSALARSDLHRVNANGSRTVAAACAELSSPPVLMFVSSLAAAGPAAFDRPRVESDAPSPVSHYGRSKLAGELAIREFADRVPITILRPPIVFGEGDRASLPVFQSVQRFGVHMSPLWRSRSFSFIHAADLATALCAAAKSGKRLAAVGDASSNGHAHAPAREDVGVYFAAADEIVTYAEFGRRVGRALGRRRTAVIPNVAASVWMVALGSEAIARLRRKPMILNLDKAREAVAGSWTCSSEALIRDTAWQPAKSLDERLAETAAWYREQGWLPKPGLLVRLAQR